jgi:hypothetical protein
MHVKGYILINPNPRQAIAAARLQSVKPSNLQDVLAGAAS